MPGPGDVVIFDSTLYLGTNANTINPAPLGGNLSILGIRVAGPVLGQADGKNGIVITNASSANTLTIGTAGIDLSATNAVPLNIQSKIVLSGSQTWNISDASANITNPVPVLPLPATQNHGDRYTALLANEDEDLYFNALVAGTPFDLGGFTLTLTNSGTTVIDQGYTVANGVINVNQGTLVIQGGKSRQTTISNNVTINVAGGATLRLQTTSGAIVSSAAINLADGSLLNLTAAGTQGTGVVSNSIAVSGNATLSQTQNPIVGGNNNITNVVAANITGDSGATLNLVPSQSGTATCVLQLSGDNSGFNGDDQHQRRQRHPSRAVKQHDRRQRQCHLDGQHQQYFTGGRSRRGLGHFEWFRNHQQFRRGTTATINVGRAISAAPSPMPAPPSWRSIKFLPPL